MEMIGAASLLRNMPKGYEEACYTTKAIVRKRDIKDPNDLMMLVLFHLLTGCSLIEVSEISKLAKLGDISDVAFMKRFGNCGDWFKWILTKIQETTDGIIEYNVPEKLKKYRILAVDASDVAEKGTSGRIFRLHFALDIIHMHAALYNITSNSVGEHLRNYELTEGDLVIADRIYSSISGIEYCLERKSQYLIRMRTNSFKPYNAQGTPLDFLEMMTGQESGEMKVYAKKERGDDKGKLIPVRICFKRKSAEALENATSLDDSISANEILELYRYRWQAELYFKRLKSILDYGEMPKKSEKSIFAWLNGKLMIALLIESMMGKADFSPSGDLYKEYMERD